MQTIHYDSMTSMFLYHFLKFFEQSLTCLLTYRAFKFSNDFHASKEIATSYSDIWNLYNVSIICERLGEKYQEGRQK
jgi:hypothetical protein